MTCLQIYYLTKNAIISKSKQKTIFVKIKLKKVKYASQYYLNLDDNSNSISGFIYPFRLPYTYFVIEINENYKKYVDEIFLFVKPIYTEYETIMSEVVRDFLKKLNEVFITFINNSGDEITIILVY